MNTNNSIDKIDSRIKYYKSQAGVIKIIYLDNKIISAEFVNPNSNQVNFENLNKMTQENLINSKNINFFGTDFQIKVWKETIKIPAGTTITYQELAQKINQPKAYRAVANALAKNKIAYFIPCHRVIRKNGNLGGYKWGIEIKKALLNFEKIS